MKIQKSEIKKIIKEVLETNKNLDNVDFQIHKSAKGGWFISLKNGVVLLKKDGTWEYSERD